MRIISLLPSATESLCAIGAGHLLVGRSHECDYPSSVLSLPALTAARTNNSDAPSQIDASVRDQLATGQSLYHLDEQRLRDLKPDLIVTQDLCSVCSIDLAAVQRIAATLPSRPRIVSLNPHTFEAVLDDLLTLGQATGLEHAATAAVTQLRERLYRASDYVNAFDDGPTVAFLEWTDPLFCAGHWTPQLIERAGAQHPLNPTQPLRVAGAAAGPVGTTLRTAGKSVTVPPEVLVALKPQRLIIAPCGWSLARIEQDLPRLQSQWWWNELPAVRDGRVALVDGNQYFNRPGPRLVDAFEWLVAWLNDRPEVMPRDFVWQAMRL